MKTVIRFIKKETVFIIAAILAVISSFWVRPSIKYIEYIDYRTLMILWSLMIVVQGYREAGVFEKLVGSLVKKMSDTRTMALLLMCGCFFSSMFITNDVALLTFIPFAIILLKETNMEEIMIPIVVFLTIAANLGSMVTPIGNPQNLYLYTKSGMSMAHFEKIMFPYGVLSFIMLVITICLFIRKRAITSIVNNDVTIDKKEILINTVLFIVSLMCVVRIIDYRISFAIVLIVVIVTNRAIIKKADYGLLLTFVAFFIFVGNMKNLEIVRNMLNNITSKREIMVSVILSQAISNVPAAILLSNFTDNITKLIIGTNLGGLGTIIASMASLISFKFVSNEKSVKKAKYLLNFTAFNVLFLIVLLLSLSFTLS